MKKNGRSERNKRKSGPEPDRLKIDDMSWQEAMGKAIEKEKPKEGWPEPEKKPEKS